MQTVNFACCLTLVEVSGMGIRKLGTFLTYLIWLDDI